MYKNNKIGVLIPAYNEEKQIKKVIDGMPDFIDQIIVVNDCSTDKTSDVVNEIKDKRINLIDHKENKGVGGAILSGHRKSFELGTDINVIMAGDNQMDPEFLPMLLDKIIVDGYDYVKGNRFISTNYLSGMPKVRVLGNIVLSFLNKVSSGYWDIFDPQNGYTAIKINIFKQLDLKKISEGYFFENSMLVELNIIGAKVADVSIPAKYEDEKSKLKIKKIVIPFVFKMFTSFNRRIFYKYFLRGVHPIFIFLFSGTILFLWGLTFGIIKWHQAIVSGVQTATGTVMLAVLPFLMGFELLLWAIVMDIQEGNK